MDREADGQFHQKELVLMESLTSYIKKSEKMEALFY